MRRSALQRRGRHTKPVPSRSTAAARTTPQEHRYPPGPWQGQTAAMGSAPTLQRASTGLPAQHWAAACALYTHARALIRSQDTLHMLH